MALNRDIILQKLNKYFNQDISKDDIHTWALSVAVSRDYQDVVKSDLLIAKTIQTIIDMHHDDIKAIPTNKALEYYRRCLEGLEEFKPLESRGDLADLNIPDPDLPDENSAS